MKKTFLLASITLVSLLSSCNELVDDSVVSIGGENRATRVVVAVFDGEGSVINVQQAEAGVEQDYEMVGENFKHRVLIEDFTGAWCVNCPRVTHTIEEELEPEHHDKFIAVALHNDDGGSDPFVFKPYEKQLHGILADKVHPTPEFASYPFSPLNRQEMWKRDGQAYDVQQALDLVQESSPVGIRIDSDLDITEGTGTVNVSFKFNQDYNEELKYIVYIVEDGLEYAQKNSTPFYGGGSEIEDFVHNAVAKGIVGTDVLGTTIPANETKAGQIFNSGRLNVTFNTFE